MQPIFAKIEFENDGASAAVKESENIIAFPVHSDQRKPNRSPKQFGPYEVAGTFDLANRRALADQLQLPRDASAEQCIALGYDKWGLELLPRLKGEFAFVLKCMKTRQIIAVRDRFGVQPLAYSVHEGALSFASDPEALAGDQINPVWIAQFLSGIQASATLTPYEGVKKLAPGTVLVADQNGLNLHTWYKLRPQYVPEADAPELIREALEAAIARMSVGQTATLLSGGLDSSALTLLRARMAHDPVRALSMVYPDYPMLDESTYIDAVVDANPNIEGTKVPMFAPSHSEEILKILEQQGQPIIIQNFGTTASAYQTASKIGAHCVLDGHGGDEVVGNGGWYLNELAKSHQYFALWRNVRAHKSRFDQPAIGMSLFEVLAAAGPRPIAAIARRLAPTSPIAGVPWRRLVKEDLVQATDLVGKANEGIGRSNTHLEGQERLHAQQLCAPHTGSSFEILRRMARAEGIDVKFPFYDQDFVELCLGQSSKAKFGDGLTRNLLREAMRGIYPEKIRTRTSKADFTPYVTKGLAECDAVKKLKKGVPETLKDYVSAKGVQETLSDLKDGRNLATVSGEISRLAQLDIWLTNRKTTANSSRKNDV
ncbi:asparagine synthase-related protein [Cognatishimia activa]|uniref:asparagine synthase (glutamine-hydrolyzing) n=1 Tax=Cognatishimia activa TaxID=1715691 RepID=A0A0P1IVJ9_9RHOB|nr:asparagine synthase-related protein [Cognatishimia activa]CUJ19019.1 Asparagine synthetase [glutamine-hydrolyzing] 3 [Cognatishimia activa]CUK27618.1 Asparagine synthetase [glutamine-hydrolyzing] 3 [Cognatishimia activa]